MTKRVLVSFSTTIALFYWASVAKAEFTVLDPQQELVRLSGDLAVGSFANEMMCTQSMAVSATAERCEVRCTTGYCSSRCEGPPTGTVRFQMHIDDCTAAGAFLYSDSGLSVELPVARWKSEEGYFVKPILEKLGQFITPEGEIRIRSSWWREVRQIVGGKITKRPARLLEFEMSFGPGLMIENGWMLLDPNAVGLKRLIALGMGTWDGNPDIFFQMHGLLPAQPMGGIGGGLP